MKNVVKFILLSLIISWCFWGISFLQMNDIIQPNVNNELWLIFGRFVPSVLGVFFLRNTVTYKSLVTKMLYLKTTPLLVILIFFGMPLFLGSTFLTLYLFFDIALDFELLSDPLLMIVVFSYILFLGGPIAEEIGWRGYLLPKLCTKFNLLISSIIVGFIWSIWHLPLFFIPGTVQQNIPIILYILYTIILSIWIGLLVKKTKEIGVAIYFHTSANFALGVFYVLDSNTGLIILAIGMLVSFIITMIYNKDTLLQRKDLQLNITNQ